MREQPIRLSAENYVDELRARNEGLRGENSELAAALAAEKAARQEMTGQRDNWKDRYHAEKAAHAEAERKVYTIAGRLADTNGAIATLTTQLAAEKVHTQEVIADCDEYQRLLAAEKAAHAETRLEAMTWKQYGEDCGFAMMNSPAVTERDATLTALTTQRAAAEKVCEAAEVVLNHSYDFDDNEDELRAALTEWRRTKEGA